MVGNALDAEKALCGALDYLGHGCTRYAYLCDGVVYKVEHNEVISYNYANTREYTRITDISSLPPGIAVPNVSLHYVEGTPVLAMEYVEGALVGNCWCELDGIECTDSCMPKAIKQSLMELGMVDICTGNIVNAGGVYYIIDLGE